MLFKTLDMSSLFCINSLMWRLSDLTHGRKPDFDSDREGLVVLPSGLGNGETWDDIIQARLTDNGF